MICLVGGSTGLIGDPRPTAERVLKTKEQTADWVDRIKDQVAALPRLRRRPSRRAWSTTWTGPRRSTALDFLRDIGKHFRVNTMITQGRGGRPAEPSHEGISYTEFSYQLLQAWTSCTCTAEYGCTATDRRQRPVGNSPPARPDPPGPGAAPSPAATPLVTEPDGTKFGKSEGNADLARPPR